MLNYTVTLSEEEMQIVLSSVGSAIPFGKSKLAELEEADDYPEKEDDRIRWKTFIKTHRSVRNKFLFAPATYIK